MARSFNGTSDYLRQSSAAVTAAPCSMACWFHLPTQEAATYALVGVYASGGGGDRNQISLEIDNVSLGDGTLRAAAANATGINSSTANLSPMSSYVGAWVHAAGVWTSSTSRRVYVNGAQGSNSTTGRTPSGLNRTSVGRQDNAAANRHINGRAAEGAIWDAALTADEIASLAEGVCPLLVRPESLVAYWPLLGRYSPEIDLVGGFELTVTGATQAEHPRVIYPSSGKVIFVPSSGSSVGSGTGSSSGTGTVSGTGASTASVSFSASGTSSATSLSDSAFGTGSISCLASTTGVGASISSSTGSSSGTGSAIATAEYTAETEGSSTGQGSASGTGASTVSVLGEASGEASGSATGTGVLSGVGASSGDSLADGIGEELFDPGEAVGTSSGSANVNGVGASIASGVGVSQGGSVNTGNSSAGRTMTLTHVG